MTTRPTQWHGIDIPYGASLDVLRTMIEGPAPAKWVAFRALAATPGVDALRFLEHCAQSPDPHVRRAAVEGIGQHPEGHLARSVACAALEDTDEFVVRTACSAVASLGASQAHERLHALLADPSPDTRSASIAALDSMWRESDHAAVLQAFVTDRSPDVRKQAAWSLRAHVTGANWLELFVLWCDADLARYRVWACEIAADFGSSDQAQKLEVLSRDANGHVRSAARKALSSARLRTT